MPIDVSVIIVNYNTRDITIACLESLYAQTTGVSFEVLLVDNGSKDGSVAAIRERFPQVILFDTGKNLGFARANNLAAEKAQGRYVCLLNSDTVVLDNAIAELVKFGDAHPESGVCGGRTFFGDLSLNPYSCWNAPTLWSTFCQAVGLSSLLPNWRIFHHEGMGSWDRSAARRVEIVSGCFMLIALGLWVQLGGFDQTFFMYAEDADLCMRVNQMGMTCMICPRARIIHYGGASERVRADSLARLFRAKSQLFVKHWKSPTARWIGVHLFDLWALIRRAVYGVLGIVDGRKAERAKVWREIWNRRSEWHVLSPSVPPARAAGADDLSMKVADGIETTRA